MFKNWFCINKYTPNLKEWQRYLRAGNFPKPYYRQTAGVWEVLQVLPRSLNTDSKSKLETKNTVTFINATISVVEDLSYQLFSNFFYHFNFV